MRRRTAVLMFGCVLAVGCEPDHAGPTVLRPGSNGWVMLTRSPPGAAQVDGRELELRSGRALVRVTRDSAVVHTHHGRITVEPGLYEVEVDAMARSSRAFAAGLGLAAASVVVVYEGRAALSNDTAAQAVGVGDVAVMQRDRIGVVTPAGSNPPRDIDEPRVDELQRWRSDIASARTTLAELEARVARTKPAEPGSPEHRRRCIAAFDDTPGCRFLDDDPELLQAMAQCEAVRSDLPAFLHDMQAPTVLDPESLRRAGVDEAELETLEAVGREFQTDYVERLRSFALECGADSAAVAESPPMALHMLIARNCEDARGTLVRQQVARERAGLGEPPGPETELPTEDRYWRMFYGLGDEFERALAAELGPDRVQAIRKAADGWGHRWHHPGLCRDAPRTDG